MLKGNGEFRLLGGRTMSEGAVLILEDDLDILASMNNEDIWLMTMVKFPQFNFVTFLRLNILAYAA